MQVVLGSGPAIELLLKLSLDLQPQGGINPGFPVSNFFRGLEAG
jgi:hypothetical protein